MSESLSGGGLRERLQAQVEEEREVVDEQLQQLRDGVRKHVSGALSTIEADILEEADRFTSRLARAVRGPWMIRPLLIGVALSVGLLAGAAGLSRWLTADIGAKIEARSRLGFEIREQSETLARIEAGTWGIVFLEEERGRFLILPAGVEIEAWTWGDDRQAVRLRE